MSVACTNVTDWVERAHGVIRIHPDPDAIGTQDVGYGRHVHVRSSVQGRLVGLILQVIGTRRFANDLRTTLERLASSPS